MIMWLPLFHSTRFQKLKRRERELERRTVVARERNMEAIERLKNEIKSSPEIEAVKSISGSFQ